MTDSQPFFSSLVLKLLSGLSTIELLFVYAGFLIHRVSVAEIGLKKELITARGDVEVTDH
jgi:hypothetical protein